MIDKIKTIHIPIIEVEDILTRKFTTHDILSKKATWQTMILFVLTLMKNLVIVFKN